MKEEKETKKVYLVDAGDYDLESPYQIIPDFMKWIEDGCNIEDDECENKSEVDFDELYLLECQKKELKVW